MFPHPFIYDVLKWAESMGVVGGFKTPPWLVIMVGLIASATLASVLWFHRK
jgi:hypothetical protein